MPAHYYVKVNAGLQAFGIGDRCIHWGRLAHYLNVHGALIILIEPNARIIVANSG